MESVNKYLGVERYFLVTVIRPQPQEFPQTPAQASAPTFPRIPDLCAIYWYPVARHAGTPPLRGAIFESYVAAELTKPSFIAARGALFFWRDSTGHEVDILMDLASDWFRSRSVWPDGRGRPTDNLICGPISRRAMRLGRLRGATAHSLHESRSGRGS